MKIRKVIINQVAQLNASSLGSAHTLKNILYLDTSNITRDIIDNVQMLNSDITPFPSRAQRKVKNNTIIYSTVRPNLEHYGLLENPPENFIVSTGFVTIDVFDKEVDPKFLYYSLTRPHITNYLHTIATNNVSSYPSLSPDDIGNLELEIPSDIKMQEKIASIISGIDSKIKLNNRINDELETLAKTLYDYWFVQFDFPDEDGKPYKASGGKMEWKDEVKKYIPHGWKPVIMSDWIESDKSGDWGKEEPEGNFKKKVTCIRGTDINGLNGLTELKPPIRYILEKNSNKILKSHDIIIEISGGSPTQSTGRIAFITDATIKRFESPLICSNFCKPISIKNKKLLYNFVYYWGSLYEAGIFFSYEGKTSGIKNLLFDSFMSSYYTVVPDDKIVAIFYDIMENLQEKKQTALAENQQLSSLRDWLLPMLMNGQITVWVGNEKVHENEEVRMEA